MQSPATPSANTAPIPNNIAHVRKRSLLPEVSPEVAILAYKLAYLGLILGGMFVLGGTLLLFWSDGELKRHDNLRLSANESETSRAKESAARATEGAERAREGAAKANERAATLENEAAQAKLELERLKLQVAWRRLTEKQFQIISTGLRGVSFPIKLNAIAGDPESMQFAVDIEKALQTAGLAVRLSPAVIFRSGPITGLQISGPRKDVIRVGEPFANAGFNVNAVEREGEVTILVGSKPSPQ